MTKTQYRKARRARGTPEQVAAATGVHVMTIHKRERGDCIITKQAEIALLNLPPLPKPVPAHALGRKPGSKTKKRVK
jgi:hypothetical protein